MLSEQQLAERKTGIGGSDAAAILGLSRYKSRVELYLQKLNLISDNQEESEASEWGNILEPIIANKYAEREGKKLIIAPNLFRSEKYPWMIANVDRLIEGENAVLECKTCSAYKHTEWGLEYTDDIPDEYLIQCAHYAIVLNAKYVEIAVLIGGQRFGVYRYERNKDLEQVLIEHEHDFWHNHILKEVPPSILTYEDASKLWNKDNQKTKQLPKELSDHLKSYFFIRDKIKEYQEQLDFDKAKLCDYLQDASILLNELGIPIATWKSQKTSRFQMDRFKESHPELYRQFSKTTESRVFRVRELK